MKYSNSYWFLWCCVEKTHSSLISPSSKQLAVSCFLVRNCCRSMSLFMERKQSLNYLFHNGDKGLRRLKCPQGNFNSFPLPSPNPESKNILAAQSFLSLSFPCPVTGGSSSEEVRWHALRSGRGGRRERGDVYHKLDHSKLMSPWNWGAEPGYRGSITPALSPRSTG